MKKVVTVILTMACSLTLAACGQKQSSSSSHHQSTTQSAKQSTKSAKSASSSSDQQVAPLWNDRKDQELADFMRSWGPTMGQDYRKYDGHAPLHVSTGPNYPADLSKETVEGGGTIGWAPSGKGDYDYNVVAIYNYNGTKAPLPNRITYLFAFHDGKPVALVDQSRDGDPRCHPTNNKAVANNFARIANQR